MQLRKDKKRKQGANRLVPQTECRFSRDFLSWEVVGKPEGTTPEKVIAKTKKLRKSYEKVMNKLWQVINLPQELYNS
jgi:hypothetical protein